MMPYKESVNHLLSSHLLYSLGLVRASFVYKSQQTSHSYMVTYGRGVARSQKWLLTLLTQYKFYISLVKFEIYVEKKAGPISKILPCHRLHFHVAKS